MAYKDQVAVTAKKYRPIQSAVPGTTLGPIQIEAILGGGKLYNTPGVHLHHRQATIIHVDDMPSHAPQSRLKGRCFPICIFHFVEQMFLSLNSALIFSFRTWCVWLQFCSFIFLAVLLR